MRSARPTYRYGFSLIEMSIVLAVMALIIGGGLTAVVGYVDGSKQQITQKRLDKIEEALLTFRRVYNRLPCPSDPTLAETTSNFGRETATPGTCTSSIDLTGSQATSGAVPFKAINLPEDFAFDGWGRRITYAVDKRITETDAFNTYAMSDMTTGDIIVRDQNNDPDRNRAPASSAAGTTSSGAYFILVSHGENGHGAFPRFGGNNRVDNASADVDELNNCNCETDGSFSATPDNIFIQRDPSPTFDDIIRFKTSQYFRSTAEIAVTSLSNPTPSITDVCYQSLPPATGTPCGDGTIYVGQTPTENKRMFIAVTALATRAWKNDNVNSGYVDIVRLQNCSVAEVACRTGKSNTAILVVSDSNTASGFQSHLAAMACDSLVIHGYSDWYLPARSEALLIHNIRADTDLSGWIPASWWTSSEETIQNAAAFTLAAGYVSRRKDTLIQVLCVRKGALQ